MTSGSVPFRAGAGEVGTGGPHHRRRHSLRRLWYSLLVLEVVAVLIPSIYARITPKLFGIPFFYWYFKAYHALIAFVINLIMIGVASAVLHLVRAPAGADGTAPEDYEEVTGPPLPPAGIGTPQTA